LIDVFHVSEGTSITFSFNDEMIEPGKTDGDNYSITIRDQKDFADFKSDLGESVEGFIQNQYGSKFLGSDFITMLAILKKVGIEYPKIPTLKHGQKARCVEDKNRIDKFMYSYTEKTELAKAELEGKQHQNTVEDIQVIDFEDLLGFFQGEDNDDGDR